MYQDIYNCICQNTQKILLSIMSNLRPNCCLKFDFQKVDQHAGGKWLIHDTKRRKDNQLQSLKRNVMSTYRVAVKGCVSLDPSKISKSGWWGLQLDTCQLCNSLWYGLINSKLHINKKIFFLYHTTSDGVTVQCFKSPSWPLRDGLDLWPQLIYTLSWESQHEEI